MAELTGTTDAATGPGAGDPAGIRDLAATYRHWAHQLGVEARYAAQAKALLDDQHGDAVTALADRLGSEVGTITSLQADCGTVADILTDYADEVEDIARTAARLSVEAADATARGSRANGLSPWNTFNWSSSFVGPYMARATWDQAVADWSAATSGIQRLAERRATLDDGTARKLADYHAIALRGAATASGRRSAAAPRRTHPVDPVRRTPAPVLAPPTPPVDTAPAGAAGTAGVPEGTAPAGPPPVVVPASHTADDAPPRHDTPAAVAQPAIVGVATVGVPLSVCFAANRERLRSLGRRLVDQVPAVAVPRHAFFRRVLDTPTAWRDVDGHRHTRHGAAVVAFDPETSTYVTYFGPLDDHGDIPAWVRHVGVLDAGTATTAEQLRLADERGAALYEEYAGQSPTALFVVSHAPVLHDLAGTTPDPGARDADVAGTAVVRLLDSIPRPAGSTLTVVGPASGSPALPAAARGALRADIPIR
ncbi:hypothetical protein [Luteimicrobium subarcticum]|uniref:Uncharacterized protein n=1 Tax=Luteimicrobium subarcticum TaxID=620910 RepID=A0A2M8W728_9MICO|nr:hypothetical protein [Luteimicrobium subarcticum]PJI86694.1 hypothetical protein CLV34_2614 [Luteimicrobium subarcticum]